MVNLSRFPVLRRRRGIDGWHKIEQVSGEMKYARPTQWPEWWWHFQTHSSMNVYTVWKKIDQRARFRTRHRNQNSATKVNLFWKAAGETQNKAGNISECEGLNSNNYDVGMLFILGVKNTLLFFLHFWRHIKVLKFSLSWRDSYISIFILKSFRFHPCFAPSLPPLLYHRIQKDFKVIGVPGRLRAGSHLCLI